MVPGYSQGSEGTRYRYYVYGQHHNKGKTICKANSIRADIAEQEVLSRLSLLVTDPFALKLIINQVNAQRANAEKPYTKRRDLAESKLKQIEKNTNKLLEALLDESMPKNVISKKLNEFEEEKNNWNPVFGSFKPSFLNQTPNQLIMKLFAFYCPIFKRFYPK